VVAVASDAPATDDTPGRIWLDLNAPEDVLAWLTAWMSKKN
jgi:hypothetical protein